MVAAGPAPRAQERERAHEAGSKGDAPRVPISVFIIARNEADRIHRTIESVRAWADEVVVIDSGSTDATVAVCEALGARVLFNAWNGYGPQKRFGEDVCRNDWLLNLDADEEIDADLARAIVAAFAGGAPQPDCAAFRLFWKNIHFTDDAPRRLAPRRGFVRLYDRRRARFHPSIVHDSVIVDAGSRVRDLPQGLVLHRSFRSFTHFHDKLMEYAAWQARDMIERGRRPSRLRVALEPLVSFYRMYVMRRNFIYGRDGVVMSALYARVRYARMMGARAGEAGVEKMFQDLKAGAAGED